METKKQIISKSRKTKYVSENGVRYNTQEVVVKRSIGKNKKGKEIFSSQTIHEPIFR